MKKTTIVLIVILVIAIICEVISLVQSFTKGIPVDWFAFTAVFASLACAFSAIASKNKKEK